MTSIQLTEELNILRKEKGLQTKFKHDNILNIIKNCFNDIEVIKEKNKDNKEIVYCNLTEEQTKILTDNFLKLLNMKKYFNYHKHTYYSNINTTDCVVSYSEYVQRSLELGHEWLSSTEHGGTFAWIETYNKSKDSGLKFIHGGEFYFVPYRNEETLKTVRFKGGTFCGYTDNTIYTEEKYMKDNSNYHLILIAKTRNAMKELNYIMSEAYDTGYYYKPRVDIELLRELPKGEVYCTSACIGGFLRDYPKTKSILEEFINIFGKDNFFLEVQPHIVKKQIDYNLMLKNIAKEYGLKLIAGVDSHMIKNDDSILRDYLLHSKGIIYEDEEGWTCDYPDYETLKSRFMQQGIWTEEEVEEFIDNTLILTNTEDIKIDTSMKVPTIFPDKSREWRLSHLKKLIFDKWNEYKKHRVRKKNREKYIQEILSEYSVIEETCTEDYFLLNYYIIRRGLELGGVLTKTGRGSGASYLINFMLGFTSIDRLKHKIPMLRERFMGKARILNGSMPDIDFNVWNREAFIQAQDELLGVNGNYFMTAYGTLGIKSAFKMLCRAKSIPIEIADEITKLINAYEKDKKHDEDLKLEDYISNPQYLELIEESKVYTGIIDSFSVSPCSFVLFNGDLRREFGLIKDKNGNLMCCVTGVEAEKLGYLKNDLLIVKVVGMNDELYKRVNIKQPDSEDLEEAIKDDKLVWDLYANGLTQCLNQMESSGTTDKSTKFKPKTLEELCAFVSIIRPATASIYKSFEKREDFKYNIDELDDTLRGEYLNGSWMIYQEQIMVLLQHLGFPDNETYTIMKAISKKKENVIKNIKPRFEESLAKIIIKDMLNRK